MTRKGKTSKSRNPKSRNDKDSIPKFWRLGVGGVKNEDSSSQESRNRETQSHEMPNSPKRETQEYEPLIRLHFRVSDTETWRCQEHFTTETPKSQNANLRYI
jgi:hypothetical protein